MNNTESSETSYYNIIKDDPVALLEYVDKFVRVQAIKNSFYEGFIHSVDPVTHSIILSVPQTAGYKTVVIPGHAVSDISELNLPSSIKPPQKKRQGAESIADDEERKRRLISWFKSNLLPVTELKDKIVLGNVTLLYPYSVTDISTDSPIVAMQIKDIMERMPHDFEAN
ncbi:unnamed protein product [Chrysodeixis includens]|uniref:AD domain-containing protein n=1 Tax=Chrysodeixis includens TaxID=689277 RepID=A0A9P0BMT6_CHRIL|nr:unnamed protein product [Chrysodeixis includens]